MAKPKLIQDVEDLQTLTEGHTSQLADMAKHKTLVFNMKENGADNTGMVACDSVIDLAVASNLPIYFPSGTYLIGKTHKFTQSICMFGDGNKLTILNIKSDLQFINGAHEVFNFTNAILRDIQFIYTGSTTNSFDSTTLGAGCGVIIYSSICDYFMMNNVDVSCSDNGTNMCNVLNVNFKASSGNMKNIQIDDCNFINNTSTNTGGGIWFTCVDTQTNIMQNISIINSYFYTKKATEMLALYGSISSPNVQILNVNVEGNIFETFTASSHYSDNILTCYGCKHKNVSIINNKFNINFGVSTPFRIQKSTGSTIFSNNVVNISNTSTEEFLSLFLVDSAVSLPLLVTDNIFNINIPNYTRFENASGYNVNFENNKIYFTGGSATKPSVRIAGYILDSNLVTVDNTNTFAIDATIVKKNNMSVVGQAVASYFPLANTSYWYKDNYFYNIGFDFNLVSCSTSSYFLFSRNEMNRNVLLRGGVLNKLIFMNNIVNNVQENWVDITSANITSVATMYHFKNNTYYTNLKAFADIINP